LTASDDAADDVRAGTKLLMSGDIDDDVVLPSLDEKDKLPVSPGAYAKKYMYNRKRKRVQKHMPDFNKMLSSTNQSLSDPNDKNWMKSLVSNPFGESVSFNGSSHSQPSLSPNMISTLKKMTNSLRIVKNQEGLLVENQEIDIDIKE